MKRIFSIMLFVCLVLLLFQGNVFGNPPDFVPPGHQYGGNGGNGGNGIGVGIGVGVGIGGNQEQYQGQNQNQGQNQTAIGIGGGADVDVSNKNTNTNTNINSNSNRNENNNTNVNANKNENTNTATSYNSLSITNERELFNGNFGGQFEIPIYQQGKIGNYTKAIPAIKGLVKLADNEVILEVLDVVDGIPGWRVRLEDVAVKLIAYRDDYKDKKVRYYVEFKDAVTAVGAGGNSSIGGSMDNGLMSGGLGIMPGFHENVHNPRFIIYFVEVE